jgi:hypothetical protein
MLSLRFLIPLTVHCTVNTVFTDRKNSAQIAKKEDSFRGFFLLEIFLALMGAFVN